MNNNDDGNNLQVEWGNWIGCNTLFATDICQHFELKVYNNYIINIFIP